VGINRLESFSDGVIAVAITLLVLGITIPDPAHTASLTATLGQRWPEYAAYVISFLTIGIIWINHHVMINRLREADHAILILNLLLLMSISVLPFATGLMATYLKHPAGRSLAAAVYAGSFLVMAIMFLTLNRHILLREAHMIGTELTLAQRRQILTRSAGGSIPYLIATPLAFVSPYLTLAICGAVAVYYAFPVASGVARTSSSG
jgi:uncharacterized membrane protein